MTASYDWDSSHAANPSEHTVSVTMQVKPNAYQDEVTYHSDKLDPPTLTGPYPAGVVYGDGRVADFAVADMQLESIRFTGNIGLAQDNNTLISTPEFTWDLGKNLLSSNPVAYTQGKKLGLTMQLCSSKGYDLNGLSPTDITMGYTLQLVADPYTTNPSNNQFDPPLTLYDNTTTGPVAPTLFQDSTITVNATTALNSSVSEYDLNFYVLAFYVKFSYVTPTPTWGVAASYTYNSTWLGNTLYAVVNTPTAPMLAPWVDVLDYACDWAGRTSDATSATTALATAEYDNCTYNGGSFAHTSSSLQDGSETLHLQAMLGDLTGQCNDFADFLVCLSNAIGARPLKPQRSVTAAEYANGSHFIGLGPAFALRSDRRQLMFKLIGGIDDTLI